MGITCPDCNGAYHDCEECEGTGKVALDRCPVSYQTPDVYRALRYWPALREGLGAVPGAMCDQAASFLTFVEFLEGEMVRVEDEKRDGRSDEPATKSGLTPKDLAVMFGQPDIKPLETDG